VVILHLVFPLKEKWKTSHSACAFAVEDMCRRYPNATEVNISGAAIHLLVMKAVYSLR
jgi:hypothetical protein